MKNTSRTITASIAAVSMLALALPAFAQISVSATANSSAGTARTNATVRVSSTVIATSSMSRGERKDGSATSSEDRMNAMENRGDKEVANRIDALNKLAARIEGMKNLSDSEKASLSAEIQASVADMNNIQAKLQSDTTTATLKTDLQTIAPDYRVYVLVEPQVSLLSAVDRINALVASLQTIQSKIQSRLTSDASASSDTTVTTDLSDMSAKLSSASSLAAAAQAEITGLKPDNGDATVRASNTAALKDARAKIQSAHQDLVSARKDAGDIVKLITGHAKMNASATTSASMSAQ